MIDKPMKLWLWRNGDHFLAFDNPMPCYPDGGDPLVLGEAAAIAILTPSTPATTITGRAASAGRLAEDP